ncbi:MAG: PAS domain S-box protein, partial [Deltaproteobacteria bacterium]|nr:PAS domain S-box protein [Deltaproteobacteria bacterium]
MARILIADDELLIRAEIEEKLTALGYDVVGQAESATEAIDMARELAPDLIFMDVAMPGKMNGIEAAAKIKEELDIAIIFISGHGEPEYVEKAKGIEPYGYVTKPFDEKEVRRFVEIALYKRDMERKLRESERRYRNSHTQLVTLFENTEDFIMIADERGFPQYFNEAYKRIMKEVLGLDMKPGIQPHKMMTDPAAVQYWDELHRRVLDGEKFSAEYAQELTDGEIRYLEVSFLPIIENDKVRGFVEVTRDISDRKRAKEALAKNEERYRLITENSTDTIWVMRLDGTFTYHSPSVEKLRGYTPEEANQVSIRDTMTPESIILLQRIFEEENSKPMAQRWLDRIIELEMYRKDGTTIWAEVAVRAIRDSQGKVIALQGSTRDITDRKHAEAGLIENENKLRLITENARDSIFIKDRNRRYTFANQAMQDLLCLREEDILGKTPEEVFGLQAGSVIREVDDRTFSGETVDETRGLLINNREFIFNTFQKPLAIEDGVVTSIMGMVRDITESKRAEKALRESEEKLRDIFNSITDLIYTQDLEGHFLSYNPAIAKLFGYKREELIGKRASDFMEPEWRLFFESDYLSQLKSKGYHEGITRYTAKDGKK